jgi:hypothetical protein
LQVCTEVQAVGSKYTRAALGAFLGAIAVVAIAAIASFAYDIPQFEGSYAMGVAFVWVPVGAVAGALFGLLLSKRGR